MKFGLMYASIGPFSRPESLARLARLADDAGFESMWSIEHVVVPVGYQSTYPYNKSGKLPIPDDMPLPDPLLPLAFAAALTKKIRLATGILILPQRHPLYVAKEVATLDVLSGGRVTLGIGSGWLKEEFDALGIPFNERGARTNEAIRALRSLWKPKAEPFDGRFYKWAAVESHPKPVQAGGVPIVVGGHSEAAARRAGRLGDGFFPGKGDLDTLRHLFGVMRDEAKKAGRDPSKIEITAGAAKDLDAIRRHQDLGVSRMTVAPSGSDEAAIAKGIETFANQVIAKL
jgi:probable F420-dependent oxidoreductase